MKNVGFEVIKLGELLARPIVKRDWVVEDRLMPGGLSALVAKPKAGKSTVSRDLAYCVATGEKFLNIFSVKKGCVLYLAFEGDEEEFKKDYKSMGATSEEDFYVVFRPVKNAVEELRRLTHELKPVLIVIDTLQKLLQIEDINDYSKVNCALQPLYDLARKSKAHILMLHHAKKGGSKGGDSILGSTAIRGAVDATLIIKKEDKYRTLESEQRFGPDLEPLIYTLDESTKRVRTISKEDADVDHTETKIIRFLQKNKEKAFDMEVLLKEVGVRKATFMKTLGQLVHSGAVKRTGSGKKGDCYYYEYNEKKVVPTI